MIWCQPYDEDLVPEQAGEAADYSQAMFEALDEAAAKFPGHAAEAHLPNEKGGHKRKILESSRPLEREAEGDEVGLRPLY
jgi:hypothetical protein